MNFRWEFVIVFLFLMMLDTPERAQFLCVKHCTAHQGCNLCKLDLKNINFLLCGPSKAKKSLEDYLKVQKEVNELLLKSKTIKKISQIQKETGYVFVNFSKRASDMKLNKEMKKKEKEAVTPQDVSVKKYIQQTPFVELKQFKAGLISYKNSIVVPFHNLLYGVFFDIILWFDEKGWLKEEVMEVLKIAREPQKMVKSDLEKLLMNHDELCDHLPEELFQV